MSALNHVPKDVSEEVQEALVALEYHAQAYQRYQAGQDWDPSRCDTTIGLAELASDASNAGNLAGFRTPRSYFEVRESCSKTTTISCSLFLCLTFLRRFVRCMKLLGSF